MPKITTHEELQGASPPKDTEVAFTVLAPSYVRDRIRVLGALSGRGLCREAGRRLERSLTQIDARKIHKAKRNHNHEEVSKEAE